MPNAAGRAARQPPNPVFQTDMDGNRVGGRPHVGPAPAAAVHANLKAQEALAQAPRPVAQQSIGAQPADMSDNPTKDMRVQTAVQRVQNYGDKIANSIDTQSQ